MHKQQHIYWCIAVAVLALAAWGSPAWAQADGAGQGARAAGLAKADANGDKQITFDELKAVRPNVTEEQFKKMDRNGDGVLTQADRQQGESNRREMVLAKLKEADKDGNGKVTFDELKAVMPRITQERFDRMDVNKDGVIDKADREAMRDWLEKADANGDKKITLDELKAVRPNVTEEQFKKMDRNGDGVLSAEDRQAPASAPEKAKEDTEKSTEEKASS